MASPQAWVEKGRRLRRVASYLLKGVLISLLGLVFAFLAFLVVTCTPEWSNSASVYVRNQTTVPLWLTLTIPRSAVQLDTVWWGLDTGSSEYRRIGYALRVTKLDVTDGSLPVALPVLVAHSADTIGRITFQERQQNRYSPHPWDQEPWLTRQQQSPPLAAAFARGITLLALPTSPDSMRLTFPLAPDSTFLVARSSQRLHHSDPDRIEFEEFVLHPAVVWVNGSGKHTALAPAAATLQRLLASTQEQGNNYHVTHYLSYR